ncbi:carbohydrate ABC transporter permease [Subtercola frigoramans]|uniref:Xylobiose transport system permease protein n=1 Tax=Subtercola frigoramans TaxID=120298 RepID=A0ABS2L070_9MICO|nr:sugar ABC transporter permease [Subtercola frigoramans]MBM7470470.1 xylobiose transport system permease protein [Subtercola frigoramans]
MSTRTMTLPRHKTQSSVGLSVGRPSSLWILPGTLFFALFAVVPLVGVAYLSFTSWNGLGTPEFTGLDNWAKLFSDPVMPQAIGITLVLLVGTIVVQVPLSLLLGVWAAGFQKNRAVLSAIYFLPLLLSSAATAIMWKQLLDPNFGIPSQLAKIFGGDGSFLGTLTGAVAALIIVSSWQFIPFHTLIYQGAARAISPTLYQAASIDGAGTVRSFFAITLPQLRNAMVTSTVLMVVGGLTAFDLVLILTQGGPGTDTTTLPYLMYKTAFKGFDMGYGSAIALLLVIVATLVSIAMVRLTGYDKMTSTQEGL